VKTEIFTFCDFAQENGGKLTVVGTFDTILASKFPCVHPQLSVVIRMRFDMWEFKAHAFKVEARNLNNELMMEPVSGTLDVKGAGNTTAVTHLVFSIMNLKFQTDGVVNFIMFLDDKEATSTPLYVRKIERPRHGVGAA
jgi:hypothetical protein